MLLAADGRRLSKRDRDLDLGELRKHLKPEQLIGWLAHAAGLIDRPSPISPRELCKDFSWEKIHGESIFADTQSFLNR